MQAHLSELHTDGVSAVEDGARAVVLAAMKVQGLLSLELDARKSLAWHPHWDVVLPNIYVRWSDPCLLVHLLHCGIRI